MLLTNVHIKRFRGLVNLDFPLNHNTIIIGENNSGKTSLLDAIRLGLLKTSEREAPFHEFDFYMGNENDHPQESEGIEIDYEFTETKEDEWSKISERLPRFGEIIVQTPSESDPEKAINKIFARVSSKYEDSKKDYTVNLHFLNIMKEPMGERSTESHRMEFHQVVSVFYLSALRNIGAYFSATSPYWIKFLRARGLTKSEVEATQGMLHQLNETLIGSRDSNSILKLLDVRLKDIQSIVTANQGVEIALRALPLHTWEVMESGNLYLKGSKDSVYLPIDRHGQGTQSLSVVLLFEAFSTFLLETIGVHAEPILAVEEPEAHLHPHAIRSLAEQLGKIKNQKIVTTHSPFILQNADLADLRLLRRKGNLTSVHYLQFKELSIHLPQTEGLAQYMKQKSNGKDPEFIYNSEEEILTVCRGLSNFEKEGLSGCYKGNTEIQTNIDQFYQETQRLIGSREKKQLINFLQKTRGDILFARAWLLLEGPSDFFLIQFLTKKLKGASLDAYGISVIDYQQGGAAPESFIRLAEQLSIPWMMLCDGDKGGHEQANNASKAGGVGFSYLDEIDDTVIKLMPKHQSFEVYLIMNGFKSEYETILGEDIPSRSQNEEDEVYFKNLEKLMEARKFGGKIGAALDLSMILESDDHLLQRIPKEIQDFIERCVELAQ
ncbi:ATP-dependent nuclease [Paenibacillus silviterrae]|uniref:ATP-dependent nuclease n=1 Tax=Paenibacillus silviterrae TaxID=3242194 RepID=UPI0025439904|nr:AAA family ATPase [Paenibacillus chinjuensis]